jgi:solute carrier family 34 (sodium-dependent phosphate cotransporter)
MDGGKRAGIKHGCRSIFHTTFYKLSVLETTLTPAPPSKPDLKDTLKQIFYILGTLLLFLLALNLMTASLQHLSRDIAETIIQATSNPFTGLFIGLLITAMMQSSSTTTALVVALVASGSLTLQSSIPIIMGANIGTTITGIIVSLGFINKKKEFKRAVATGAYHCFFNLLTVVVLFPLEYYYGFLSTASLKISGYLSASSTLNAPSGNVRHMPGFDTIVNFLVQKIPTATLLLSFALLFSSILLFRKIISNLLKARSPQAFSRFFFKRQYKSFFWGLLTTAAIRSSTITTSVVVPIVAKRITTLEAAAPFIMGANVGTTVTVFIAAALNTNGINALSIALAHLLFNLIGVLLFFPVPAMRRIPIELSNWLGRLTLQFRLAGFVFLLLTFFFIPFILIYFNQGAIKTIEAEYERFTGDDNSYYYVRSKMNSRTKSGDWLVFDGKYPESDHPSVIYPVSWKNTALFIGNDMYLFNKAGYCWDGEDTRGKYQTCVGEVLQKFTVSGLSFDSVYVFQRKYRAENDSIHRIYLSSHHKILLARDVSLRDSVIRKEEIILFMEK